MSNITADALFRVIDYNKTHSDQQTCQTFNLKDDTLERYKRKWRKGEKKRMVDLPNVLLFDIETSPMEVLVWGLYKQRPNYDNIVNEWYIISWSAKWLFSNEVMSDVVTPEESINKDDKRICESMWNLFETANIIIAHNAKRFDVRKVVSRWMVHGMKPPSPYQVIDTLTESRKMAAHSSHRLDYLGQLLKNKGKMETEYGLWKRCMAGDPDALFYMEKYNKEDVRLLEEVYLEMRPWIKSHPNIGIYLDENKPQCAACGSTKLHPVDDYVTQASVFPGFRCDGCGHINRGRSTQLSLKKKKSLLCSTAR